MTYEEMFEAVKNGADWYISFEKKTLLIDGKTIIDGGLYFACEPERIPINVLERYFRLYVHSIPTKNEPSRPYFRALKYGRLSEDDKSFGESRDLARFRLEYAVLQDIISGKLTIPNGQWFWRSSEEPDFIILRSWVEKEQEQ